MLLTTESKTAILDNDAIPAEAAMVISALEAGKRPAMNRRAAQRYRYRVAATLRLFSDEPGTSPAPLYTREVNRRGLGFVTTRRLALGHGGVLELPGPTGQPMQIHCTLLRCREAAPGWFEGGVYFNREQPEFEFE
jgi:hypothetical protein